MTSTRPVDPMQLDPMQLDPMRLDPAAPPPRPRPLAVGAILAQALRPRPDEPDRIDYYEFVPARVDPRAPLLVSVHGISGNAREHVELFCRRAEEQGVIVIAPVFAGPRFHGFQRPRSRSGRAANFLLEVVAQVRARHRLAPGRFSLFGFSGGAQFAHRFALLHPRRIRSLIVCSAGWYTFPDPELRYPFGLDPGPGARVHFRLDDFLRVPVRVAVGALDVRQDHALNASPELCRLQGDNRVERARRWADALRRAGRARGVVPSVAHAVLPACGHSFRRCVQRGGLAEFVFASMF
jgi:pimeloyl-ACP methyl ester carboxylesterase